MSLVNDALKKARLEAARQDAARRGLPMPGAQLAGGSGVGAATLVRVGAVGAVVILLALLLFFAGRRFGSVDPADRPLSASAEGGQADGRTAARAAAAAAEPLESADQAAAGPPEAPAGTPARPTARTPIEPPIEPPVEPPVEPQASSSGPPRSAAAAALVAPTTTKPADPPPPAASRPAQTARAEPATEVTGSRAGEPAARAEPSRPRAEPRVRIVTPATRDRANAEPPRTVVRVLELPGAIRIELGGIAWSEERPFALLNGRVVGPGEVVESLAVVAIAQRHVELQGEAGHFLLRLK